MIILSWAIIIYVIFFCSLYGIIFISSLPSLLAIPLFEDLHPVLPQRWPKLSIIIVARNEAETIKHAIESLLQQGYPDCELILVNDRSTDETGTIIDTLADHYPFIQALHIQDLPKGWLGKVYALQVGTQKAEGEWLLYTDADVHFYPGALQKAMAHALSERYDHFTIMPRPLAHSLWLELAMQSFGAFLLRKLKVSKLGQKGSRAFAGIGAFNLVKKLPFDKTEGFSWLRMETLDDIGLGLLLASAGMKSGFALSTNDISLVWYPDLRAMFRGVEKNLFGGFSHYSFRRTITQVLFIWLLAFAPLVSIFSFRVPYLWVWGIMFYIFLIGMSLIAQFRFKQRFLSSMLSQVGMILFSLLLLHSGITCLRRKGIIWRGTRYGLHDLRAGQRIRL